MTLKREKENFKPRLKLK